MIHTIKIGVFISAGILFSPILLAHPPSYCQLTDDLSCVREAERRIENSDKILPLLQKIEQLNEHIMLIQMRIVRLQAQMDFINDIKCTHLQSEIPNNAPPCPALSLSEREYVTQLKMRENLIWRELNAKKEEKMLLWEELFLLYPSYRSAIRN